MKGGKSRSRSKISFFTSFYLPNNNNLSRWVLKFLNFNQNPQLNSQLKIFNNQNPAFFKISIESFNRNDLAQINLIQRGWPRSRNGFVWSSDKWFSEFYAVVWSLQRRSQPRDTATQPELSTRFTDGFFNLEASLSRGLANSSGQRKP